MVQISNMDKSDKGDEDNGKPTEDKEIRNSTEPQMLTADKLSAQYTKESDPPIERVKFEGISDKDSICSDDEEVLPPIPDGGWGWVVVVAAFLVCACADGLAFSFGILHEEFTNYFQTTQSKTSLIGSLFIATPLLAGPVMSALVDRYGCRTMTMIAGVLSTCGFLLASVSDSVGLLCLTFGFITGLAMGILYVTGVVSVAFWFDKRRNLAVSLASCGIGFGTFVYPALTKYLLSIYDWRNTIVMLAGTLINMCVCGALMRNPEWLKIKQKRDRQLSKIRSRKSSSAGSVSSRSIGGESVYLDAEELKKLLRSGQSPELILATLASNIEEADKLEATTQANAEQSLKRMHSAIQFPTFIQQHDEVPTEVIEKLMENKRLYNIILRNYPDIMTRRKSDVNLNVDPPPADAITAPAQVSVEIKAKKPKTTSESEPNPESKLINGHQESGDGNKTDNKAKSNDNVNPNQSHEKSKPAPSRAPPQQTNWLRQISTTDHHYLKDMPLYKNTMMHRGAMLSITRYKLRASSLPDMYRNSSWSLNSDSDDEWRWYDRLWMTINKTFDFKMFTEFHFLMFNLSSLILSIWFIVPYFFLSSYMSSVKVEGSDAVIIGIIGVFSSIGIVALGWAGDQPWMNVTKAYAVCLMICGLSVAAYPLVITNYWLIGLVSAIFGLSFASSYSYTPAILMELMPIDKFTVAYGLILLSQGIGHLVGPPIGGLLFDLTESWDLTFYMGGFWLIISGIFVGVIAYTKDFRICGTAPLLRESDDATVTENSATA